jgi:SAM-dependent methyltransferase
VSTTEQFQISADAAEIYESRFVPAIFGEWAPLLVDAAGVAPGHAVLDIACGTGVVARAAADRLGGRGTVTGADLNPAMLAVASRLRPDIVWRQADAAVLPFPDASFDVVLCQAALMFFPDVARALGEMARVVTASGTVGLQVWDRLEAQPAYGPLVDVATRLVGSEATKLLSTYWRLGDREALAATLAAAGLHVTATRTHLGTAHFTSIDELVATEVESTPLGERITPETYRRILEEARAVLDRYRTDTGRVEAPISGHLLIARR